MISYQEPLSQHAIAISISESPDMPSLGLSDEHLSDAMAEITRHLLALGARLVYGGDLRAHGFSQILFELVARHRRDADDGLTGIVNYLAWPVHISMTIDDLQQFSEDLTGSAELVYLALDGSPLTWPDRKTLTQQQPTEVEWVQGLTAMRHAVRKDTHARIVVGGRVNEYKGIMPGIAEEALLSLQARQPLFVVGGFGGCARDIAETLGLARPWAGSRPGWAGRSEFRNFTASDLRNGLTAEENATLACTPHVDQAVTLVLRGLLDHSTGNLPDS